MSDPIIVKALPWHSNAPRDGTWWVGYENAVVDDDLNGGDAQHVIAHSTDPVNNRFRGASHAEAVAALAEHIEDAQDALEALKKHQPYGEFSE